MKTVPDWRAEAFDADVAQNQYRGPASAPLAVVDIGSNTVRLVIYDGLRCNATPILNEKVQCELGAELARTGRMSAAAMALAFRSLERFRRLIEHTGAQRVDLLATAAVREANNGDEFIAEAERISGHGVQLLSGKDEARLSGLGVIAGIPDAAGVAADLGGGSLELSVLENGDSAPRVTLPLGPLLLMESGSSSSAGVQAAVRDAIDRFEVPPGAVGKPLFLVGGAWRAYAKSRMERTRYPLRIVHNYRLDAEEAYADAMAIAVMDRAKLSRLPGVPAKRRRALPYAALVMAALVKAVRPSQVVFSAAGLREGWVHELLPPDEKARDPLLAAASGLETREGRCIGLGDSLFRWTDALFADEAPDEVRLRHAACLLSDIGWHDHPDHRGIETMSRILRIGLPAIDHPGLAFLAVSVFHRYGGPATHRMSVIEKQLLKRKDIRKAAILGGGLRLAYELSGGVPEILGRFSLQNKDAKLELTLPDDGSVPPNRRWQKLMKSLNKVAKSL